MDSRLINVASGPRLFVVGAEPMENKPKFIKQHKQRGEWAEARFMASASEHGFNVSKPWGDTSRYDFAIELKGRFLRIQVKSTMCRNDRHYICSFRTISP